MHSRTAQWLFAVLVAGGVALRVPALAAAAQRNWVMLGVTRDLVRFHDPDAARARLERAHADADSALALQLGRLLVEGGRSAEAIKPLATVVSQEPANPVARLFFGAALADTGRTSEAVEQWRVGGVGRYFTLEADALLNDNRARAERLLHWARQLNPRDATACRLLAKIDEDRGAMDDAVAWYETGFAVSRDPEMLVAKGVVRLRQQRFEDAIEAFRAAVASQPRARINAIHLGDAFRLAGDMNNARRWYTHALSLEGPGHALAYRYLGELDAESGHPDNAIGNYRAALALSPLDSTQQATTLFQLGRALFALRRHAEAEATLRRALAIEPGNAHYHLVLGQLLAAQSKWADARIELVRAIQLSGSNIGIRDEAARSLGRLESS